MIKALILVLIAEIWMTAGQIFFKKSADHLNKDNSNNTPWILFLIQSIFSDTMLWLGGITMLIGLIFWFAALNAGDLSLVYLLGSIQYIFALFAAHFFLKESLNTAKIIGTILISLGIILTVIN